jgi:PEGA domain.
MRPVISVLIGLGFLSAILLATMIATSKNSGSQNDYNINETEDESATGSDGKILAVVNNIDMEHQWITLFNIDTSEEITMSFNGGTNITDKYDKIVSISQIPLGSMVDVSYQVENRKMISMNLSKKAWEYAGASHLNINLNDQFVKIGSNKYRFNNHLTVLDGEEVATVNSLAEQDEVTVWGYDKTIWSIIITKGHGTVRLEKYKDYLGDSIKIGHEAPQKITDNLELIVREGEMNLTVENGKYSATKSIDVVRNQVTYVPLNDLGPIGPKTGKVTFLVTPDGADLTIDGKLATYSDPIEIEYGEHSIKASLGGYNTYEGTLKVDSENKTIRIKLPEETSKDDATATETGTNNITPTVAPGTTVSGEVDTAHKIYVQSPVGASVYLDGSTFIGTAPCSYQKVIGSHILTFIKTGYTTRSYPIEVAKDGLDAYFTYPDLVSITNTAQ